MANNSATKKYNNNYKETYFISHPELCHVMAIDKAVHDIINSEDKLFYIMDKSYPNDRCSVACKNNKIFNLMANKSIEQIDFMLPIYRFNPYVELFIRNMNNRLGGTAGVHRLINCNNEIAKSVDSFNCFIDRIREEAKSKSFKIITNNYKRSSNKNYISLLHYIDNLFINRSRLLVLRIDLSYENELHNFRLNKEEINHRYLQAKKDREHFFNNMRSNTLFDDMLGYVWKLEYGFSKGFHYHMIFFFDGSKVQQDITIAEMIGKYWQNVITQRRGIHQNCNINKKKYKYPGIGMINHDDIELRENLNNKVAHYLIKPDYYARMAVIDEDGTRGRTFAKGIVKPKTDTRGRPRNQTVDIQQECYASEIILIEQLVHGIIQSKELFCVCHDRTNNRYYIGANDDFMRDVLNKILNYKNKIIFIDWILSKSVHPTVALFIRNLKDRLVVVKPHLYTRRRNRNKLKDRDVRVLNEFIESIRHEADSPQFKKAINDYYNRPIGS